MRNTIDDIVDIATNLNMAGMWPGSVKVTVENIRQWQKQLVFDCLGGMRYGESFCTYFGIPNSSPLYWFKDSVICKRWIKDNYIKDVNVEL